jgi:hypothetical protein
VKRSLALLLVMGLVLVACSSSDDNSNDSAGGSNAVACDPAPAGADVTELSDFPAPDGTTYTGGEAAGPSFIAEGYFDGDLQTAFDAYHQAFDDAGYDVTKDEKEDNDAEVFFAGNSTTGQVNLFVECDGRTKLRITVRPD